MGGGCPSVRPSVWGTRAKCCELLTNLWPLLQTWALSESTKEWRTPQSGPATGGIRANLDQQINQSHSIHLGNNLRASRGRRQEVKNEKEFANSNKWILLSCCCRRRRRHPTSFRRAFNGNEFHLFTLVWDRRAASRPQDKSPLPVPSGRRPCRRRRAGKCYECALTSRSVGAQQLAGPSRRGRSGRHDD